MFIVADLVSLNEEIVHNESYRKLHNHWNN